MTFSRFFIRLLGTITVFVLSVSVIRLLFGADKLSFSYFLYILEDIRIDFSHTIGVFAQIKADFNFTDISGFKDFFKALGQFFNSLFLILTLPLTLLADISSFLSTVFSFLVRLVGFDFIGFGG